MFPILGLVFTLNHAPLVATTCSVVFIALTVSAFIVRSRLPAAQRALADAEQRLADARKMRDLEHKLAAAVASTKVRIDTSESADAEPISVEPEVARKAAR